MVMYNPNVQNLRPGGLSPAPINPGAPGPQPNAAAQQWGQWQNRPPVQNRPPSSMFAQAPPGLMNQKMAGAVPQSSLSQGGNVGFRGYQQNLAEMLMQQAQGGGQSISDLMFQQAADRNLRQQLAMAAGQRGNLAGAQRLAQQQAGQFVADTAGEAAAGRLAEQRQAQALLGSVAGQGRGQDIGVQQSNLDAMLRQQQLNQSGSLGALGLQAQLAGINAGMPVQPNFADQLLGAGLGAGQLYLQTRDPFGGVDPRQQPFRDYTNQGTIMDQANAHLRP